MADENSGHRADLLRCCLTSEQTLQSIKETLDRVEIGVSKIGVIGAIGSSAGARPRDTVDSRSSKGEESTLKNRADALARQIQSRQELASGNSETESRIANAIGLAAAGAILGLPGIVGGAALGFLIPDIADLVDPDVATRIQTLLDDLQRLGEERRKLEKQLAQLQSEESGTGIAQGEMIRSITRDLNRNSWLIENAFEDLQEAANKAETLIQESGIRPILSSNEAAIGGTLEASSALLDKIESKVSTVTDKIRFDLDLALADSATAWEFYRDTVIAELCAIEDKAASVGEKVRGILGDTSIPRVPVGDENINDTQSASDVRRGGGTGRPITSGGGGVAPPRQFGGPVGAGQSFLVGERGPEMFVPGRAGTILPNAGGRGFGSSFGGDLGSQLASVVAALDALRAALEAASDSQGSFREGLAVIEAATRTLESRLGTMDEAVRERLAPVLDVINTTLPAAQAVVQAFEETTVESVVGAVDALLELTGAEEGLRNLVGVIGQELTTALSGNLKTWEDWARFAISAIDNVLRAVQQLVGAGGGGGSGGGLGSLFSLFGGAGGGGGGGSSFLNIAATRTSIPGGIGGFAAGGNPITGLPALVGERGVELAVPRIPTTIIPNHRLGEVMGGTAITVHNTFIVKGRLTASERAETFAIADEAAKRNVAAFKSGIARGGGDARLVGRRR